jgi:transposase-like protein
MNKTKPHICTEEEKEYIRCNYKGNKKSSSQIAYDLGISFNTLKWQLQKLGISYRHTRYWTKEEKNKLIELSGKYCVWRVARILNRSLNSIHVMRKVLNITRIGRDGWYTGRDICNILGINHNVFDRWVNSKILVATKYTATTTEENRPGAIWHISKKDLKLFIRTYPQELIGKNIDIIQIVDILSELNHNSNGAH